MTDSGIPTRLRSSLHFYLLLWLVIPMAIFLVLSLWITQSNAKRQAGLVTDQLLVASARVIAEQIRFVNGSIEANIPPAALEVFATQSRDRAVYRIIDEHDKLIAGYDDLTLPDNLTIAHVPNYYNITFRAEEMRAVGLLQPIVTSTGSTSVLVIVAETLKGQDGFQRSIWIWSFAQQTFFVALAGVLIWLGISRSLRPILQLSKSVAARDSDDFSSLPVNTVQSEFHSLVAALNDFMARFDQQVKQQRIFLDDAAHQLRTPIAILKTQLGYALKSKKVNEKNEALIAADATVDSMTRLANQLLVLARVEHEKVGLTAERFDIARVAADIVSAANPRATLAKMRLTLEGPQKCWVMANEVLVREMLSNLIDNAILYAGHGALVKMSVFLENEFVVVVIEDNGPGMSIEDQNKAFQRFSRGKSASGSGSGLGLAIVAEIARQLGGQVALTSAASGGVKVQINLPKAN